MAYNLQQWHGGLVDPTLTKETVAADAKATGVAIEAVKKTLKELQDTGVSSEYIEEAIREYLTNNPIEGVTNRELEQAVETALQEAKDSGEFDGPVGPAGKGVTFTPAVSEDGTLSWTNDGGLANPNPVNIMGPAGANGEGAGTVTAVTANGKKYEPDQTGNVDLGDIGGGTADSVAWEDVTGKPDKLPNPNPLTINGKSYDGSEPVNVTISGGGEGGAQYINELLPDPNEESVDEENVVLPVNADKLGGKSADEYLQKSQVVDNFTTTQEGFVADARAVKALNDSKLNIVNAFFGDNSTYTQIAVSDFDTFIDGVTKYGNMMQTAINKAAVQHGEYYFGNLQYVLYSINFERTYGWLLSISFSGIYFGCRRNTSKFTWVKIA